MTRRRPRPPKIITRVIVFLLLGAIVNVAVAWGFSLRSWNAGISQTLPADENAIEWWRIHTPAGFPAAPTTMYVSARVGFRSWMMYAEESPGSRTQQLAYRHAHGWPMVCLEWTSWSDINRRTGGLEGAILWHHWPSAPGTSRKIPLQPLWPAFPINTIFYAAILWVLFFTLGSVRRRIRRRRGLCPACAYPVGTSPVCTECGRAVLPTRVQR